MLIPEIQALTGQVSLAEREKPKQENTNVGFEEVLRRTLADADTKQVNLSKHAIARAEERGIDLTEDLLDKLSDSVERAQEKGATNILAFDQSLAFIVNVPNSRVITLMRQDEMKESIFTNIDGAVLL